MTKPMTFISLFAGIGGMDLGLERAGMQCVAQVEIDDYASKILAKHWPDVARFRDVRTVGAHNLPACDLICGGFPCQDISNAGKQAGITGERSGLWREFARIIGELRPRYALIENVSALLGRGLSAVLCDLAALGYDAEWHCIPAAAVGAPHIRDRVFVLAYAHGAERRAQSEGRNVANRDDAGWQEATGRFTACSADGRTPDVADATGKRVQKSSREDGQSLGRQSSKGGMDALGNGARGRAPDVADADSAGLAQRQSILGNAREKLAAFERGCCTGTGQWSAEPAICRMADGVPRRVDRLRGLGNAVVPQVAEYIGRVIMELAND